MVQEFTEVIHGTVGHMRAHNFSSKQGHDHQDYDPTVIKLAPDSEVCFTLLCMYNAYRYLMVDYKTSYGMTNSIYVRLCLQIPCVSI